MSDNPLDHPNLRPAIGAITMAVLKEYGAIWLDWQFYDGVAQLIMVAPDRGATGFRRTLKWSLAALLQAPDPVESYREAIDGFQARSRARADEIRVLKTQLARLELEQRAEGIDTLIGTGLLSGLGGERELADKDPHVP